MSRPPLNNLPNPGSRLQQENLVSFRPYDAAPSVKQQIDFTEHPPKVNVSGLLHRVSQVEEGLSENESLVDRKLSHLKDKVGI